MAYILFVHACDSDSVVEPIIHNLRLLDIDCLTYKQKLKLGSLSSPVVRLLEDMVQTAGIVMVFASQGLTSDYHAMALINYASTQGNLISFILPGKHISLPESFYRAPVCIALKPEPVSQKQILSAISAQLNPYF